MYGNTVYENTVYENTVYGNSVSQQTLFGVIAGLKILKGWSRPRTRKGRRKSWW